MPRRRPYTAIGIRRVPCARCGAPSRYQWSFCADGNVQHGLCPTCDLTLNALLLEFITHPERETLLAAYAERVADAQRAESSVQHALRA